MEEAEAARDWYAARSPLAARAFVTELMHSVDQVAQEPEMWPVYEIDTRRYVFRHFSYSLFCRVIGDRVRILAVGHAKRKPGYWKGR